MMKRASFAIAVLAISISWTNAYAQQPNLAVDCAAEINNLLRQRYPGFRSHRRLRPIADEDKIPARCRLTAYLGSDELGVRMKALKGLAKTCSSDILQYCSKVPAGGGRIYDCLIKNKATLTDDCRSQVPAAQQYMKD